MPSYYDLYFFLFLLVTNYIRSRYIYKVYSSYLLLTLTLRYGASRSYIRLLLIRQLLYIILL